MRVLKPEGVLLICASWKLDKVIMEESLLPFLDERHYSLSLIHIFGYNPDKTILKDISLYAKPGQKIAFVGSTGAGKTTITNLINRFYDIDKGKITIDDVDIKNISRDDLRRNIAMVLQDTHLFTGTVRENIRYGRLDATDEEVEQAARTASAHSFIMRLDKMCIRDRSTAPYRPRIC